MSNRYVPRHREKRDLQRRSNRGFRRTHERLGKPQIVGSWAGGALVEAAMTAEPSRAAILKVIKHARETHQPCEFGPLVVDTVHGRQPGYRIKLKGHAVAFITGTWISLAQTGALDRLADEILKLLSS
jgi:hypothetical protein